ncbi:MAG: hypothetical protein IBJ10_06135 [Phycisphaerales bacterium]|nr:hypothetical protein [Phycisphaerales bacterium]
MTNAWRPAAFLAALASAATAAPTIEYLPAGFLVTDLSYDGSVMVGNVQGDGSYETFRWTAESGIERLGRATVPAIGVGAGSPDVSYDGRRVSASILSMDNLMTQGVWDVESGWTETMPPSPPTGIVSDQSYGSAWGLSGDGSTLTGFFWRSTPGGNAHPNTWSPTTGIVPLESVPGVSARANAANYDGSVVVGWEDNLGPWQPTVWRNGVKTRLVQSLARGEARAVNADGSIIVGAAYNPAFATTHATIWRLEGDEYTTTYIGALVGTVPNSGSAWLESISDTGSIAVGFNQYTFSPGGSTDGVIWTPENGLVKDVDFLAGLGLSVTPGADIRSFTAVSPNGAVIAGALLLPDLYFQTFIIRLNPCPADLDGDGEVGFGDLNILLGNFNTVGAGLPGDLNGDGRVDFADLNALLGIYNTACG